MKNWEDLVTSSELLAVLEIKNSFVEKDFSEVEEGLNQLIKTMSNSEKRELTSELSRLMQVVAKWKYLPESRNRKWLAAIFFSRYEIKLIRKYSPILTDEIVKKVWKSAFIHAQEIVEIETNYPKMNIKNLSWEEVFEQKYNL